MSKLWDPLLNAHQVFRFTGQLLRYAFSFFLALMQPKAVLAARLLAVESQLSVCKHRIHAKKDPRPQFTAGFRVLWVILSLRPSGPAGRHMAVGSCSRVGSLFGDRGQRRLRTG